MTNPLPLATAPTAAPAPAPAPAVRVFETPEQIAQALAGEVLRGLEAARAEGRRYLLGFPSGRSLAGTYRALRETSAREPDGLRGLTVVLMDEYLQPAAGGGFALCPDDAHYSCRRFAREHLVTDGVELFCAHPADPSGYDARIAGAGGVDLFLLASGATDGHVAFNPPGTALESKTRVVRLADSTRRDNLHTFPQFRELSEVPTHGVSVGLGTIARLSREVVMVVHGAHKRETARRILSARGFEPDWPATVVHACRGARVWLDRAAAGEGPA